MTFKEWETYVQTMWPCYRGLAETSMKIAKAEGEKDGTAAERKRILGLLDDLPVLTKRAMNMENIRWAIEHPAGESL